MHSNFFVHYQSGSKLLWLYEVLFHLGKRVWSGKMNSLWWASPNPLNSKFFFKCCSLFWRARWRNSLIFGMLWNPAGIYLLKVNNRNTRTRCEICAKLTIRIPERRQWRHWRRSGIFIVNFEHISHLALVFLLLNLNMWFPAGRWSIFSQIIYP